MVRSATALLLSILIHGLIAAALIAYLEYAPCPDVLATLDLSSVELSFAEKVEDTQPVAAMPPAAVAERRPPKPKVDEKPPEVKLEKPLPPEAGEIKFPEPREDARLKTEDVVKKVPPKDSRTIEQFPTGGTASGAA